MEAGFAEMNRNLEVGFEESKSGLKYMKWEIHILSAGAIFVSS
jgi:hypothetical protein